MIYPTDTTYGLGCDATDPQAVAKILDVKHHQKAITSVVIIDGFKMLESIIEEVPEVAWQVLKLSRKPTTIIYDRPKRVAENLISSDNTLAVRVTKNELCRKLIRAIRAPLVSAGINKNPEKTYMSVKDIPRDFLEHVDCVVDLPLKNKNSKPSSIIRIAGDGTVKVIRE